MTEPRRSTQSFGGHSRIRERRSCGSEGPLTNPSLWRAAVAGGVGGGANATLCYLRLPVAVQESAVSFHWHVIPAGFAHGAMLALIAVAGLQFVEGRRAALRWCGAPIVAWFAGYASWIPLDISVANRSFVQHLSWPAEGESSLISVLWSPLPYFGGVAGLLYLSLLLAGRAAGRPWVAIAASITAGTLGSLWWWIEWGPWYFSLLHGSTWGVLVGLALSRTAQTGVARE